jgi:hypothetical protein
VCLQREHDKNLLVEHGRRSKQPSYRLFAVEVGRPLDKVATRMLLARGRDHSSRINSRRPLEIAICRISRVGSAPLQTSPQ